jgi:hypothetical protein
MQAGVERDLGLDKGIKGVRCGKYGPDLGDDPGSGLPVVAWSWSWWSVVVRRSVFGVARKYSIWTVRMPTVVVRFK